MINFNKVYELTKTLNILYVEDDTQLREDTYDVLITLFSKVDMAIDGKDAINKYKLYYQENYKYYDIVISDINMPFINGVELTKLIYKEHKLQPIIIVSAYNDASNLLEFVNIGIEQFLVKPLNSDKILDVFYTIASNIANTQYTTTDVVVLELNNNYSWNYQENILYLDDKIVKLSIKELLLMQLFMKNKNKISLYKDIIKLLWEDKSYCISVDSLKPIVSTLRKKVPYQKIESLSKLGYRLVLQ